MRIEGVKTDTNTTLTDNRAANPSLTAGLTLENLSFEPRYTAAFGTLAVTELKKQLQFNGTSNN